MLDGFLTDRNAQDIANMVQLFYEERDSRSFFELPVSRLGERRELWIRPHLSEAPVRLANGDQIVRCESNDGYQVDIIVPRRDREYVPATVVIATHPGARS